MARRKANARLRSVIIKISTRSWLVLLFQQHYVPRGRVSKGEPPPSPPLLAGRRLQYTGAKCPRTVDF
ncbi:hypothetical protein MTO96_051664 [Rhipicephalus appendiculatus]